MLTSSSCKGERNDLRTPWVSDKPIVGAGLLQLQGTRGVYVCGAAGNECSVDRMLWGIHLGCEYIRTSTIHSKWMPT